MKRTVRKIKRMVCCLLVGLLLSEQIVSAVYAEENTGSETVSGNEAEAVQDGASAAESEADEELAVEPYAEESGTFTDSEGFQYAIDGTTTVVCTGKTISNDEVIISIPGTVEHEGTTYTVHSIGANAFEGCKEMKTINIPEGVTTIGESAFKDCIIIENISLPDSITAIEASTFAGCTHLKTINIPEGVTSIGESAFSKCGWLTSVDLPEGITEIADRTFEDCKSMSITLPESLTTIGVSAFEGCEGIKTLDIPKKVTSIGERAFMSCTQLTSVNLLGDVKEIKESTFNTCLHLSEIHLPSTLEKIGVGAFGENRSLKNIDIPESVTVIEQGAFYNNIVLSSINLPKGVTSIGSCTFEGCVQLESVTLPEGITTIEEKTFDACINLKSIEIPQSVTSIKASAFRACWNLEEVKLGDVVNIDIGTYQTITFQGCKKLSVLTIVYTGRKDAPLIAGSKIDQMFDGCPKERSLVFVDANGNPLPDKELEEAQNVYRNVNDGDTSDNLWFGWKIGGTPVITSYAVTIKVNKDDQPWADSGKTFCLSKDSGNTYIIDLEKVADGTYKIYEVTGTNDSTRAVSYPYQDTGVEVTVNGGNAEATVDYYTVTFYDGDAPYGENTQQSPQIVLKDRTADRPAVNPAKEGFTFKEWMTEKDGGSAFNFGTPITETTGVYASWTKNAADVYEIIAETSGGGAHFS